MLIDLLSVCLMRVWQECETWLNIAGCQEEHGASLEEVDNSYTAALNCAERASQSKLQVPDCSSCSTFTHPICVHIQMGDKLNKKLTTPLYYGDISTCCVPPPLYLT